CCATRRSAASHRSQARRCRGWREREIPQAYFTSYVPITWNFSAYEVVLMVNACPVTTSSGPFAGSAMIPLFAVAHSTSSAEPNSSSYGPAPFGQKSPNQSQSLSLPCTWIESTSDALFTTFVLPG